MDGLGLVSYNGIYVWWDRELMELNKAGTGKSRGWNLSSEAEGGASVGTRSRESAHI
jgi:hypothetical protein